MSYSDHVPDSSRALNILQGFESAMKRVKCSVKVATTDMEELEGNIAECTCQLERATENVKTLERELRGAIKKLKAYQTFAVHLTGKTTDSVLALDALGELFRAGSTASALVSTEAETSSSSDSGSDDEDRGASGEGSGEESEDDSTGSRKRARDEGSYSPTPSPQVAFKRAKGKDLIRRSRDVTESESPQPVVKSEYREPLLASTFASTSSGITCNETFTSVRPFASTQCFTSTQPFTSTGEFTNPGDLNLEYPSHAQSDIEESQN
ncbi:hypothetical protein BDN72DRAFT_902265 [Pluteus cervinus]|uniref:Uncharacterized protein n=1 Tax=Pluteus cervinus TaxID=181527 RepID=A0ACD3ACJ3_9AGAR|nr:hypothetical protein BDN72DRAFT_902265 [Pluteus cervinus]